MDNFAERLRQDAAAIDARISPELDARIDASLRAVTPDVAASPPAPARRWPLWFGGALAAGIALMAVVGVLHREPAPVVTPSQEATLAEPTATAPAIDLDDEAIELITPLSRELDNLQADLRKAEQILRDDLGF